MAQPSEKSTPPRTGYFRTFMYAMIVARTPASGNPPHPIFISATATLRLVEYPSNGVWRRIAVGGKRLYHQSEYPPKPECRLAGAPTTRRGSARPRARRRLPPRDRPCVSSWWKHAPPPTTMCRTPRRRRVSGTDATLSTAFDYESVEIYCFSRNSPRPSAPPSRPIPDCLVPPKGADGSDTRPRFSPIMP